MLGCTHVRDAGLAAVAGGCPNLHTLRLTGCFDVTDRAIGKLATHCTSLTDLSLAGQVSVWARVGVLLAARFNLVWFEDSNIYIVFAQSEKQANWGVDGLERIGRALQVLPSSLVALNSCSVLSLSPVPHALLRCRR